MSGNRTATGFNLARVHPGEWLAGLLGVLLIVGLLLPWSGGEAAYESPGLLDVLLTVIAVLAILLPLVVACSPRTNVPVVYETLLWTATLLFGIVMVIKIVFRPDGGHESGFWLALGAIAVLDFALWRCVHREG